MLRKLLTYLLILRRNKYEFKLINRKHGSNMNKGNHTRFSGQRRSQVVTGFGQPDDSSLTFYKNKKTISKAIDKYITFRNKELYEFLQNAEICKVSHKVKRRILVNKITNSPIQKSYNNEYISTTYGNVNVIAYNTSAN